MVPPRADQKRRHLRLYHGLRAFRLGTDHAAAFHERSRLSFLRPHAAELSATLSRARWWRVVASGFGGSWGRWLKLNGAVRRDHLGDGVLQSFDALTGDGGDFIEG